MSENLTFALIAGVATSAGVAYYSNMVKLEVRCGPKSMSAALWNTTMRAHKRLSWFGVGLLVSAAMVAAYFSAENPVLSTAATTFAVAGAMLWYESRVRLYAISKGTVRVPSG